ncbi:MAG: hypothetical protein M3238_00780, partial [Actinomycetota bacterium]|nr:hypothetical protein [Actinomycetota bacterium]
MAARTQDLLPQGRSAVVYEFPTATVRAAAARERRRARRRHRAAVRRRRAGLAVVGVGIVVVTLVAGGPEGSSVASAPGAPRTVMV